MLIERLQAEWRTRGGDHHADSLIKVTSDGLTLGAGTILFGRSQGGPLTDEARLQALLTTAYGPAAARDAFAHVELAGRRWLEGKTGRASLHLALARLPRLAQPEQAAKRLFMADHFMRAGVTPESILDVLTNGPATEPAALKAYNPDQPRVPAGDGRPSGRWSSDPGDQSEVSTSQAANCATGVLAPPAWNAGAVAALLNAGKNRLAALIGGLSTDQIIALGLFAARFAGPAAALGYVFVPTDMGLRVEGTVKGIPGLSYRWNRDETRMVLTYEPLGGVQTMTIATLGEGGKFRDGRGNVVAAVLPNGGLIIDPAAVGVIASARTKGSLCPDETKDHYGDGPDGGGTAFALFAKAFVNPEHPTPPGMGYATPILVDGKPVVFDDCQLDTGRLFEFKGNYRFYTATGGKLQRPDGTSISGDWLSESGRQLQASEGRPITWLFSNQTDAYFAKRLFAAAGGGRQRIDIEVLTWDRVRKWWAGITV